MKTLIIVPAYNEESTIKEVVSQLNGVNSNWDILVINDGSQDRTSEIVASLKEAELIDLPINLGIGGGVQTGFLYAKRRGYDRVIQFDGDGQHIAAEIPQLLAPLEEGLADVVIGSRFLEHKGFQSTFLRRIGIKIFERVNSLLIHQKITDNTSGFRAYNRRALSFLSQYYPTDYPEPEAVILLAKNGFDLVEVPTLMNERQGGVSSISGFGALYYMVKVLLAIFMTSIRRRVVSS